MLTDNGTDGSFFQDKIITTSISRMSHSIGGGAAIFLATRGSFPVSALGLIAPATFIPDQFGEISNFSGSTLAISGTNDIEEIGADGDPLMILNAAKD
jgi:hypothetical protein